MIPLSHPRYKSLKTREQLERGVAMGMTSLNGLIAHGRGEAFDYLLGEKTHAFAQDAISASSAALLLAKHPVISVNGNTSALVPKELVVLSNILNAPLEVNLFHLSQERLKKIKEVLIQHGAKKVLLPDKKYRMKYLASNRKYINPNGILTADIVFIPLEDGDRAEALIKNGKKVIAIDLNPLSRTSQHATVTIVDNVVRSISQLVKTVKKYKKLDTAQLRKIIEQFDNKKNLKNALKQIHQNLT